VPQNRGGHRRAARRRDETDYIFHYRPALGWTILTLGIYGLYVFYQLIRRVRDHNARRLELLDAATAVAWEQAGRQGPRRRSRERRQRDQLAAAVDRFGRPAAREDLILSGALPRE